MKKFMSTAVLSLILTACGSQSDSSGLNTSLHPDTFKTGGNAFFADGAISEVRAKASAQGLGLWTEIDVEYLVHCSHSFKNFSYSLETSGDTIKIIASALVTSETGSTSSLTCQAFSHHVETISIGGIVSRDSLELVNLTGPSKALSDKVVDIAPLKAVKVVSTRAICQEGAVCKTDGTIVTLSTNMICVNEIGPVAFNVASTLDATGTSKVDLTVSAFQIFNEGYDLVRCAERPTTFEVMLPAVYTDVDSIKLNLIR